MVIAKPGLDGHDRGAKIIARALRDAGMEVIYTGLHQTPEQIVETAIQEDADAVGISILSGAHMTLVPRILEGLRAADADDVLVIVGGTIPTDDADELKEQGVAAVFTPGAPTSEIVDFLRGAARRPDGPSPLSTGSGSRGRAPPTTRRAHRPSLGVTFTGQVNTVKLLRQARRECAARRREQLSGDRSSSSAFSGTPSSTGRASIGVHLPPGQTRTPVTESSSTPASADTATPLSPSVTIRLGCAGSANRRPGRLVQVRKRVDIGAVARVHLEMEMRTFPRHRRSRRCSRSAGPP